MKIQYLNVILFGANKIYYQYGYFWTTLDPLTPVRMVVDYGICDIEDPNQLCLLCLNVDSDPGYCELLCGTGGYFPTKPHPRSKENIFIQYLNEPVKFHIMPK